MDIGLSVSYVCGVFLLKWEGGGHLFHQEMAGVCHILLTDLHDSSLLMFLKWDPAVLGNRPLLSAYSSIYMEISGLCSN